MDRAIASQPKQGILASERYGWFVHEYVPATEVLLSKCSELK
jgi:hypothetical protein